MAGRQEVNGRTAPLIEEGEAFMRLTAQTGARESATRSGEAAPSETAGIGSGARDGSDSGTEHVPVIVIGAGQAGLSVGYHLRRLGVPFVILNADARVGDAWRRRWDSLRLFTPAQYDSLDGMPFPARRTYFPTKDEMADYLEAYAHRFELPVRNGIRVDGLFREGGRFVITAGPRRFAADQVVVAMSNYQKPVIPEWAGDLDPATVQLHAVDYRNPAQLRPGSVLLAGAGNSGADIGMELAAQGRTTWLSGRSTGHIPFRIEGFLGRHLLVHIVLRLIFHRVLTLDTPMGRKARPVFITRGGPLIRIKPRDLAAAGIRRVGRVAGVKDGRPLLEDGNVLDPANVIWCTGFHAGFSWIRLPAFGADGEPEQVRGVVPNQPGLYFVGLHFLSAPSSTMIQGVGRDARHVAGFVGARAKKVGVETGA